MTSQEILMAIFDGKKIRIEDWPKTLWIELDFFLHSGLARERNKFIEEIITYPDKWEIIDE